MGDKTKKPVPTDKPIEEKSTVPNQSALAAAEEALAALDEERVEMENLELPSEGTPGSGSMDNDGF